MRLNKRKAEKLENGYWVQQATVYEDESNVIERHNVFDPNGKTHIGDVLLLKRMGWVHEYAGLEQSGGGCWMGKEDAIRRLIIGSLRAVPDKTSRGFALQEFVDYYGAECSVQKSSIATEDLIWLGVDKDPPEMTAPYQRMHLTRAQVAGLLPVLKHFVETGELPNK